MIKDATKVNDSGKCILFTGSNSGIGFYSVINLLRNKNYLYLTIRSIKRKKSFIYRLSKYFDQKYIDKYLNIIDDVDFIDIRNILKIKKFLQDKDLKLDIVILNAGMQYTGALYPKVSKQGIELTFAVNHFAHFCIINQLISFIKDSPESRIIITSSDVHDPKSSGGNVGKPAGLNNLINFKDEIIGKYQNFSADKSYKNSKLCNILFAKELSKKLKIKERRISVITWAPGLVIPKDDLGFFRYSTKFNKIGYLIFSNVANNILGISENVINAGRLLSEIAFYKELNDIEYIHLSNKLIFFKKHQLIYSDTSIEANDSDLADKLWKFSNDLASSFGIISLDL
tara:strand:+ start:75 stop:1100 length:1026 start_codon:yes stop_codon:yes gene_type:complete